MYNRLIPHNVQNTMARAVDIFNSSETLPIFKKIFSLRKLYDSQEYRSHFRYIPGVLDLNDRLVQYLIEARISGETQAIHELIDIAMQYQHPRMNHILEITNMQQQYQTHTKKQEKTDLKSISQDQQNVHNSQINEHVKQVALHLIHDFPYSTNILSIIRETLTQISNDKRLKTSLSFIENSSAHFGKGITLLSLLFAVWGWIQIQENKQELYNRLIEELIESDQKCSTGFMARLVSVPQGFTNNKRYMLNLENSSDHMKKVVFAYLTKALQECDDEKIQDAIMDKSEIFVQFVKQEFNKKLPEWLEEFGKENDILLLQQFLEQFIGN